MGKNNVIELAGRETTTDPLTDLLRTGAQRLIQQAVESELQALLTQQDLARLSSALCINPSSG